MYHMATVGVKGLMFCVFTSWMYRTVWREMSWNVCYELL